MAPTSQRSQNTSSIGANPAERHLHTQMPFHLPPGNCCWTTRCSALIYKEEGRFPQARLTLGDVRLEPLGGQMRW